MKYLAKIDNNNKTGNIFNGASAGTMPKAGMRTSTKIFIVTAIFMVVMFAIRQTIIYP